MEDRAAGQVANRASRFELAPPRHFVLPAILLLLSEKPGYGYQLVKDLGDLGFGRVDRPSVYRALSQLESDALATSWQEAPSAGSSRRVYGLTELGSRMLRAWMSVIKEERDGLDRVLRRYQASGTTDAMLAEVDGDWAATLRSTFSPVSPSSPARRRSIILEQLDDLDADVIDAELVDGDAQPARYQLVPDRSAVMIEVRSSVGPISFGALGLSGWIDADVAHGTIRPGTQPAARIDIAVDGLSSGNRLYDAELLRRIDARRFPVASIDLGDTALLAGGSRYRLRGDLRFHGVDRPVEGTVDVAVLSDLRLRVKGEQVFDIRDYDVPSPTVLMLRIYPDVRVHLHVEAERVG
jgi:PadR family transcriptional regulator PadR